MSRPPYHPSMQFCVLGPLSVRGPLGEVEVYGAKERALLAHLVSAGGRVVTVDELTDSLWRGQPSAGPGQGAADLRAATAQRAGAGPSRGADRGGDRGIRLPDRRTRTRGGCAAVRAAGGGRADGARRRADAAEASATLREALATVARGRPTTGSRRCRSAVASGSGWMSSASAPTRTLCAAEVDLGRAAAAVPELEQLVDEHPWRERAWGVLVLALVRAGRQGDALGALERARLPPRRRAGRRSRARSQRAARAGAGPRPRPACACLPSASDPPRPTRCTAAPAMSPQEQAHAVELVREEAGSVAVAGEQPAGRPGGAGRRHPRAADLRAPRPEPAPVGRLSRGEDWRRTTSRTARGSRVGRGWWRSSWRGCRPTAWSPSWAPREAASRRWFARACSARSPKGACRGAPGGPPW